MNPPLQPQPERSITATPTPDTVGLGKTPGQRGAEVIAGIRAELMQSPEATALVRTNGRVFARLLMNLSRNRKIFDFIPARYYVLTEIVRRQLKQRPIKRYVEIASGFSTRTLEIANAFPDLEVMEVDLPDVIAEKKNRLNSAGIAIPANMNFLTADLGVTNLKDVLQGNPVDIVCAEGLNLYFKPEEIIRMNRFVLDALAPNGVFITEVYSRQKFLEVRRNPNMNNAVSFFLRQAGNIPGLSESAEMTESWFTEAGFSKVERFDMGEVMKSLGKEAPMLDLAVVVVAQKAAS
jgi:O-methyltransferase involved in polyketide biosynthesis